MIFPASSFVVLRYLRPYAILFCLFYVHFSLFSVSLSVSVICLLQSICLSFPLPVRPSVYSSTCLTLAVCLLVCLPRYCTV